MVLLSLHGVVVDEFLDVGLDKSDFGEDLVGQRWYDCALVDITDPEVRAIQRWMAEHGA